MMPILHIDQTASYWMLPQPPSWANLDFMNGGSYHIRFGQLKARMMSPGYVDWIMATLASELANRPPMGEA